MRWVEAVREAKVAPAREAVLALAQVRGSLRLDDKERVITMTWCGKELATCDDWWKERLRFVPEHLNNLSKNASNEVHGLVIVIDELAEADTYLAQEPELEEDRTVRENIELGLAHLRSLLDEYEAVSERFADEMSDDEMDKLINRQAELQDQIDATNAWELDRMVDVAMEALRVPDPDSVPARRPKRYTLDEPTDPIVG